MNLYIEGTPYYFHGGDLGIYLREITNELETINFKSFYTVKREQATIIRYESENEIVIPTENLEQSLAKILQGKNNIYHCFNNGFTIPEYGDFLKVSSIYSLFPVYFEEMVSEKYAKSFYEKVPRALINSDMVIALSESIRRDLLENFNIAENKLKVIYPGINSYYRPIDKAISNIYIKSKFSIDENYLLYIGELHERKRLYEALKVFKYISSIKEDMIFIMNFTQSYYNEEALRLIKNLIYMMELEKKVIILDNLTISDKLNLYNSCSAFIDLSFYEGLNISLLEAFSCKCKIVTSPIEYYHEILGDYSFYLDVEELNLENLGTYEFNYLDSLVDYIFGTKNVDKQLEYKPFYKFNIENHISKLLTLYDSLKSGEF